MPLLYLARPIDKIDVASEEGTFCRDVEAQVLLHNANLKWGVYRPHYAFEVKDAPPEPYVRQINNTALLLSDMVLAIWPANAKSWGVPAEVERAVTVNKPVVVITNGKPSWAMLDEKIEIVRPDPAAMPQGGSLSTVVGVALQHLKLKFEEGEVTKALREAVRTR